MRTQYLVLLLVALTGGALAAWGAEEWGEPVVNEGSTMEVLLHWSTPTYRSTPPQTPLPTVPLPPPTLRVRVDDKDTGQPLLDWTYQTVGGNPGSIILGAEVNRVLNPTPSAASASPRGYERHVLKVEGSGEGYVHPAEQDFLVRIQFERPTFTPSSTVPPTAVPTATATRRAGR